MMDERAILARALLSPAAAPVQQRAYDVAPEPYVQPGTPSVSAAGSHFAPLDTTDPTALMMLAARLGQTEPETARLWQQAQMATDFAGGIRAFHGGPGTYEWATGLGQRGAIDQFRASQTDPAFFAASPGRASEYAVARYPERAAVYPVELDDAAMLRWDQSQGFKTNRELTEMAQQRGANVVEVRGAYDGITDGAVIPRVEQALGRPIERGAETIYMVLDPAAITPARGR